MQLHVLMIEARNLLPLGCDACSKIKGMLCLSFRHSNTKFNAEVESAELAHTSTSYMLKTFNVLPAHVRQNISLFRLAANKDLKVRQQYSNAWVHHRTTRGLSRWRGQKHLTLRSECMTTHLNRTTGRGRNYVSDAKHVGKSGCAQG